MIKHQDLQIKIQFATTVLCAVLIMFCMSCNKNNQPCLSNNTVAVKALLKTSTDTLLKDTIIGSYYIYYPLLNTSFKYNTTGQVGILLNTKEDSTKFIVSTDPLFAASDTVTVRYKRNLHFISKACGFNYFYQLSGISHQGNNLKSISLIDTTVTDDINEVHMWFVY